MLCEVFLCKSFEFHWIPEAFYALKACMQGGNHVVRYRALSASAHRWLVSYTYAYNCPSPINPPTQLVCPDVAV